MFRKRKIESFFHTLFLRKMHVSYGVFAMFQGKILILQHRNGKHWSFCKGHPYKDESPLQTALRELYEETGLWISKVLAPDMFTQTYPVRNLLKTVYMIPAEVSSNSVKVDNREIMGYKWISPCEIDKEITYQEDRDLAIKILRSLSNRKNETEQVSIRREE